MKTMMGIRTDAPSDAEMAELRIMAMAASRMIRLHSGLTQAELARKCMCHQQSISLIERGLPDAPLRVLRELIAAAGIVRVAALRSRLDAARAELQELERQAEIVEQGAAA